MAYAFAERMVQMDMTAGDALASLRGEIDVENRWWYWRNYVAFNLWGDPSVGLSSHRLMVPEEHPDAGVTMLLDAAISEVDMGEALSDASLNVLDGGVTEDQMLSDSTLSVFVDGGDVDGEFVDSDQGLFQEPSSSEMGGAGSGCYTAIPSGMPGMLFVVMLGLLWPRRRHHN